MKVICALDRHKIFLIWKMCWIFSIFMFQVIIFNNSNQLNKYKTQLQFILVHSRFPITRFPVTRPPFYERVTPPHNEQTIDPSSPTTTEWSALEFERLYFLQISQFFIPFSKFVKITIFLLIVKTFLFFWKYSKIHLISIDIFIIILLYF